MLGVIKGNVQLRSYSPIYKELFNEEKILLEQLLGNEIVDIQHIGSTSIEGIDSNPVIDILVGVKSIKDVEKFDNETLRKEGYYHLTNVNISGKIVYAKFSNLENLTITHLLHVVSYNGDWWNKHIFFRDYLIGNKELAKEYEQLKRNLAMKYPNDEKSYSNEKKHFVNMIIKKSYKELSS